MKKIQMMLACLAMGGMLMTGCQNETELFAEEVLATRADASENVAVVQPLPQDVEALIASLAAYAAGPAISGPGIIGGSETGTYSVSSIPTGTNLVWSYDTSLFTLVSSTSAGITLKLANPASAVDAVVMAYFYDTAGNLVSASTKYVGVGGPHSSTCSLRVVRSSDGVEVYPSSVGLSPNTYYYAYFTCPSAVTVTWSPDSHITILESSNSMMYFKTDNQGWSLLNIYGTMSAYGVKKLLLGVTLYGGIG